MSLAMSRNRRGLHRHPPQTDGARALQEVQEQMHKDIHQGYPDSGGVRPQLDPNPCCLLFHPNRRCFFTQILGVRVLSERFL